MLDWKLPQEGKTKKIGAVARVWGRNGETENRCALAVRPSGAPQDGWCGEVELADHQNASRLVSDLRDSPLINYTDCAGKRDASL